MATAQKAIGYPHITKQPGVRGGKACIDGTRIAVIDIVQAHSEGKTPQEIQDLFAVKLSLARVYSALAYSDENREEIEAQYAENERAFDEGLRARDEYLKKRTDQ
jgi:uncharacterized protein (DUF433 family)